MLVDSSKFTMRVRRGMVFWFDPYPYEKDKNSHSVSMWGKDMSSSVQAGKRPWLVVSTDYSNSIGGVCNICPITTVNRSGTLGIVHPSFEYRGKTQYVMVEQITTVDLFSMREYECFVSDDVLRDVENAMKIQFGIRESYRNVELVETLKGIETVIESVIRERLKDLTEYSSDKDEEIEDVAVRLGELFEDLISDNGIKSLKKVDESGELDSNSLGNDTFDIGKESSNSAVDRLNKRYGKYTYKYKNRKKGKFEKDIVSVTEPISVVEPVVPKKRNRWDDSRRREFVNDCSSMSGEEISEKYGLHKSSISQTRYMCIKKLKDLDSEVR